MVIVVNFVPKERSRKTIRRLLEKRQRKSDEREAKRREKIICEDYGRYFHLINWRL